MNTAKRFHILFSTHSQESAVQLRACLSTSLLLPLQTLSVFAPLTSNKPQTQAMYRMSAAEKVPRITLLAQSVGRNKLSWGDRKEGHGNNAHQGKTQHLLEGSRRSQVLLQKTNPSTPRLGLDVVHWPRFGSNRTEFIVLFPFSLSGNS